MLVTLNAPEGLTGLDYGDEHYPVVDGKITLPVEHYPSLVESHGFTLADEQPTSAAQAEPDEAPAEVVQDSETGPFAEAAAEPEAAAQDEGAQEAEA